MTVDAILDAVSRVIGEEGADAVTTNRVAAAAGVSIGTLYQYFANKQEIFNALHERNFERRVMEIRWVIQSTEEQSLARFLATVVDAIIAVRLEDPELNRLLDATIPKRLDFLNRTHPLSRDFHAALVRRLPGADAVAVDRIAFVLSHMIESMAAAAALWRPSTLTLDAARAATVDALDAVVNRALRDLVHRSPR
ncbi:MAG: helix-turn-helix domain-containing protein [Pseudomonadota bacterium]